MTDELHGEAVVYPMRPAARRIYAVSGGGLLMIPPLGAYYLLRSRRARVEVSAAGIAERSLAGTHASLRPGEVKRIGICRVPLPGGLGGAGARVRVGGDVGVNLCWKNARGRTRSICVSMYEGADGIVDAARRMTGLPVEEVRMGFWRLRWPEGTR